MNSTGQLVVVCMAPRSVLSGSGKRQLAATVSNLVTPVTAIWSAVPGWHAPIQYCREAGTDLSHVLMLTSPGASVASLSRAKHKLMAFEQLTHSGHRRVLNLNPALVSPAGVVAASHKPKGNIRTQLSAGVWGQWVLERNGPELRPTKHTFSEYSDPRRLADFGYLVEFATRNVA